MGNTTPNHVTTVRVSYLCDQCHRADDRRARPAKRHDGPQRAGPPVPRPPPTPEIRGRTGYYGSEHVARLELIKDLQADGFNLESIRRILERTPGRSAAGILEFTRAVAAPFTDEKPEVVDGTELVERWGDQLTLSSSSARRNSASSGRLETATRSPVRLQRASEEIARLGVPLGTALDVIAVVKRHAAAVSRQYVRRGEPFEEAGEPEERWGEMRETLDRLRPLATESLVSIFQIVMTSEVERTLERELVRAGRGE